jgi:Protein of unknown function (DUF5131)
MGDKSSIEWTEATWNPTTGCDRITSGCDHCYALTLAKRLKAMDNAKYQIDGDPRTSGPGFGVAMHPDTLSLPLRWREPRIVFVNSMSDLFHARVSDEFIHRVFAVMPRSVYRAGKECQPGPGKTDRGQSAACITDRTTLHRGTGFSSCTQSAHKASKMPSAPGSQTVT